MGADSHPSPCKSPELMHQFYSNTCSATKAEKWSASQMPEYISLKLKAKDYSLTSPKSLE